MKYYPTKVYNIKNAKSAFGKRIIMPSDSENVWKFSEEMPYRKIIFIWLINKKCMSPNMSGHNYFS